jgi:hypothetical protein
MVGQCPKTLRHPNNSYSQAVSKRPSEPLYDTMLDSGNGEHAEAPIIQFCEGLKRKDTTELRGSLDMAYRKPGGTLIYPKGQVLLCCLCIHILVLHPIKHFYPKRSRTIRDRTSLLEAFQILIADRWIRTLPSQCQSVHPNHQFHFNFISIRL